MKEVGLIFQDWGIRAILAGKKDLTRRMRGLDFINTNPDEWAFARWEEIKGERYALFVGERSAFHHVKCPYSKGAMMWARETWWCDDPKAAQDMFSFRTGCYYKATEEHPEIFPRWKSSLFMPRWASRIALPILDCYPQRLQEISEEDAKREGVDWLFLDEEIKARPELGVGKRNYKNYLWHGLYGQMGMGNKKSDQWPHQFSGYKDAKGSFSSLWESINGPGSWESNPWIWRIEFGRTKP